MPTRLFSSKRNTIRKNGEIFVSFAFTSSLTNYLIIVFRYAQCDPNKPEPDYNYDDCMYYGAVAESAPAMAADSALGAGAPPDKLQEDSFETNNQVRIYKNLQ